MIHLTMAMGELRTAKTDDLEVAYYDNGPADGAVAVLLHGFPYDALSFEVVASMLADRGIRSITPYLRGYGQTRFLKSSTPRSGQQAAVGQDLLDLIDALELQRPVVAGYDWGGRAACIAAAVRPLDIAGLVTVGGYAIQDIASSIKPAEPLDEYRDWYQWYFNTDRGRAGLQANRDELCRLLWQLWSPEWADADEAFNSCKPSLHNPDFVDVAVHSYRHRHRAAVGDDRFNEIEAFLAKSPPIPVPTISFDALADGFGPDDSARDRQHFAGPFEVRRLPGIGHNVPQEAPGAFSNAVADLLFAAI
ncbi:alpha/beta hydrolase [Arthrobacter sp. StoSoilB20]|uniref:alpha/beta fold hydrolase n=1 Tax=Arthrobacter sp. StoSoilB20 TaxID=2830995 RepID=UPI001CC6A69B|nr:alpha/beta hydrolase [Arthrobacter sp. StoSoilB20]BCW56687.1 alpha/beta hydrolase [Arthrobacter sp. StoSoilB20]